MLFPGTIRDNIAYGLPEATDDEIIAAAKVANAHEFVSRMPLRYDAIVGERGDTLSGGQRQRMAIARAVIRNSPILVLDEPTAALDTESERLVIEALRRLMKGRTVIMIAHRPHRCRQAHAEYPHVPVHRSEPHQRRHRGPAARCEGSRHVEPRPARRNER